MEVKSEVKKTSETLEILDTEQEISNHSTWLERKSFRITLISTFSALAIVLGYLLAYIPNIELFTLTIFLSGFILGKRDGMIIGLLSSFIFCFFNPFGASPLPLLAFQLTHYSITGLIGALTGDLLQKKVSFELNDDLYKISVMIIFGFIGALITVSFQIFSSLVDVLSYFGTIDEFVPYFLTGIIFTAIHIIGNTLGFIFILPGLIQLIKKMLN
ncbi:MAG: ECF transporter S component [Candidatus Lokiarchaeota archaeon]|nr:ECF transporter S component [Candidatus Lokiarchaeota archaeon]